MRVGVVDIGTNSMRLLVTGEGGEEGRWVEVTGLGRGVDRNGALGTEEMERTIEALRRFGRLLDTHGVDRRAAMATSATRDASNREEFLDLAEQALGVRPGVISGEREGALAYAGAVSDMPPGAYLVVDIGGGSTELVTEEGPVSVDIGSVRLTDRLLSHRPASPSELASAAAHVVSLLEGLPAAEGRPVIGVAGTWTSLAAIDLDLPAYDPEQVHHHVVTAERLAKLVDLLAGMTVEETAAIPSLDPGRAPVILAGGLIAREVLSVLGVDEAIVSEHDTLDGLAMEMLAVP